MFDDLLLDSQKWVGAECSKHDPEIWFNPNTELEAKAICRTCPLLMTCAKYAMENNEGSGVWGSMSPNDRHALRRRRLPENKIDFT